MGISGTSYLRLNVVICGVNQTNEAIINRVFPVQINENKRKREEKDDNILYTARIFRGAATSQDNLNRIKNYLNKNFNHFQNEQKKVIAKNVVLYFSDENQTPQQNSNSWVRFANHLNRFAEHKIPFIIFLSYGEIDQIRQILRENGAIFGDFQDKRKIKFLRLFGNENEENREINYRKILSYLWEMTLIYNQKPYKPSKNPEANLYRIQRYEPTVTIKLLLTGFTRKGKSTFINLMFDEMVTLESPSVLPITSEIIEFLLPCQPNQNNIVKGGVQIFDVPGIIEGTNKNMSNIIDKIKISIKNQEYNHDVINYILFFLCPAPNFDNTLNFLKLLNEYGIKVIFIINRDRPRDNGMPNTTKSTLIDHLRSNGFNNLIRNNGNNILEVDLIQGVEGRTNEIFRYIHNDLTQNNRIDNNVINQINDLQNQQLFPYLHNHFDLFSKISSMEDLIERGNNRANLRIAATIPLIIAVGFSPIPFIDIPIYLLLIALMLIGIFNDYGFYINKETFKTFFDYYNGNNAVRNLNDATNIFGRINQIFGNITDENIKYIIKELIHALSIRLGIEAAIGVFDFIPGGFIVGGIINSIINAPMIKSMGNKAKEFLAKKIRDSGGRENIMNIIEGYRDSFSILEDLRNRIDYTRKIQIIE